MIHVGSSEPKVSKRESERGFLWGFLGPGWEGKSGVSGTEKGVITKGVFSLEESLESLKSLNSLESLENGRILLYFPQSGGPLKSLESLENGLF